MSQLGPSAVSPPDILQTRNGSMKLLQARNDRCSPHNRLMRYSTWSRDRATRSLHPGLKLLQLQCIHHAQLITTSSTNQSEKRERERDRLWNWVYTKEKKLIHNRVASTSGALHSLSWICMGLSTKVVINAIAVQSASRATTTLLCASRRQCLVLRPTHYCQFNGLTVLSLWLYLQPTLLSARTSSLPCIYILQLVIE
jgi:hypothetical protein